MTIEDLVRKFQDNSKDVFAPGYREHQLRVEYLNPFFELLGWDVSNSAGRPVALKDVVHEDKVRVEGRAKAPDYGFRTEGSRRFFVEAKSPAVGVGDAASALQLRRYGWSAKLSVSILTDFTTLKIYDCRIQPNDSDNAEKALLLSISYSDFVERWDEIFNLLSRESVISGSLEKFACDTSESQGFAPVDEAFLKQIENWRRLLAGEIYQQNKSISLRNLNFAVQIIIDRIIFLRIAEDRGIEPFGKLFALCDTSSAYKKLVAMFRSADLRYNSGLFHFQSTSDQGADPDSITPDLRISDAVIKGIIRSLYRPESPYEFSVMPAEILGSVYEQFLGKVIRLAPGGAIVEDKPEVKKAGGVYYTPIDVVRFIVERSLKPYLTAPPLATVRKEGRRNIRSPLRVLDPACGSGSFLIEVYQQLLDWHLDWYVEDGVEKHARGREPKLIRFDLNEWRLSIAEKRRILLTHIYGVDIDGQAVEVTKLSLLLKMLEGESSDALAAQMDLFDTRVLPDLGGNIKCGNSLVGADIFPDLFALADASEEINRNNPFEWEDEFPFEDTKGLFDVVVGNPPYIDSEWMTKHWPHERKYCTSRYQYASGNWDIFCVFIGRSSELLRPNGILSFIVPNKLMTATYASATRSHLLAKGSIDLIRDYSAVPVFPVAVYPIVFSFKAGSPGVTFYEKVSARTATRVEVEDPIETQLPAGGSEWRFEGKRIASGAYVRLGQFATISDAATVSEAYQLRDLLQEKNSPSGGGLRVVNSGTIDPYVHFWGKKPLRYLKRSLVHPVLPARSFASYSERRISQSRAPKILVANMTKRLEAIFDEDGSILATKSVNVLLPTCSPWLILAILNSNFMSCYYEEQFHGRKLAGGYLQVVPATLRELPIPTNVPTSTLRQLEDLCRRLIKSKSQVESNSGHALTLARRQILAIESAIEKIVIQLYATI